MRRLLLLFCCAACSSSSPTGPAAPEPASDGGAADAGHVCARMPFTSFAEVPGINTPFAEDGPRLSRDELTIVFHKTSIDGFTIYAALRSSVAEAFRKPIALVPSAVYPALDGDRLYYDANRGFVPNEDIFVAPLSASSKAVPVAEANTAAYEGYPSVAGGVLYFASDRPGAGKRDLYGLNLETKALEPLTSLDSAGDEILPTVSADGREIFFQRDGHVMTAWRDDPSQPFGAPEAASSLDDVADTRPGFLSPDGCRLYVSRKGDLWVGSR